MPRSDLDRVSKPKGFALELLPRFEAVADSRSTEDESSRWEREDRSRECLGVAVGCCAGGESSMSAMFEGLYDQPPGFAQVKWRPGVLLLKKHCLLCYVAQQSPIFILIKGHGALFGF